jgi:hypothetical protein
VDTASLGFMLYWTRSGVEGEDHLESVVRADALLCHECRLLGVGRKAWILSSKEHGHALPWHDPVLKAFEGSRIHENMANPFCGPEEVAEWDSLGRIVASFDHERSGAILRKSNWGDSMLPLDRRHRFDGQEVAWGRMGDGPALVLIHGTPFSSQVWRRIAPLLARRWTVYYFDLLGYGLSDMRDQQNVRFRFRTGFLRRSSPNGKLIVPMCSAMISVVRRLYAAISSTD